MMGETRSDSKLERPPLTLVLAEFRFARVALEGNGLAALKARLQPTFPDLQEGAAQQVRFGERGVTVELTPVLSWSTPDRGRFVHVEAERLIVATTRYPRFAGFAQHCLQVVEAVLDALRRAQPGERGGPGGPGGPGRPAHRRARRSAAPCRLSDSP